MLLEKKKHNAQALSANAAIEPQAKRFDRLKFLFLVETRSWLP